MQLSQAPGQLVLPFGADAGSSYINTIPVPSQIHITPGAASYTDGFPPLTMTDVTAGGVALAGPDMNGILNEMSAVDVWMCAGGGFPYNSTFSTAIGGYPKGARVLMASGNGYWVSTVDNNTSDPDTGGSGWASADENAITALTGDVTATGPGSATATLAASGVTAGSYIAADITVDAKGRVTAASNGVTSGNNSNGYWTKLPNGLILQFGTITWTGGGTGPYDSFSFPTSFATTNYSISGSASNLCIGGSPTGAGDIPILAFFNFSTSGADWRMDSNGGVNFGSSVTFSWMAMGF